MLIKVNNLNPYESKDITQARQMLANEAIYQELISQGLEPDKWAMNDSIRNDLPYICFIETEYDLVYKGISGYSPQKGWIPSILYLIYFYNRGYDHNGLWSDLDKANYWWEVLINTAKAGGRISQAALINSNEANHHMPEERRNVFKNLYNDKLIEDAQNGDWKAQFAMGMYLIDYYNFDERIEWMKKATSGGSSDVWHELGEVIRSKNINGPEEQRMHDFNNEVHKCRIKGAECDYGMTLGYCQYETGEAYHYGEHGMPVDKDRALYWYEKAQSNGYDTSMSIKNLMSGE